MRLMLNRHTTSEHAAGRRPTMRDIAREVGVSQSLVSIVFRDAPGASDETRQKVLETADRLGYVRNESARSLRSTRSTSIGVAFQTRQPFHGELLDGLYAATADLPNRLVLSAVSDFRDEAAAIRSLVSYRCGALVLLGSRLSEDEILRLSSGIPVVSVARRCSSPNVDWVVSDDFQGMSLALDHLTSLGHRRIVYLSAPISPGGRERQHAFEDAAESHRLDTEVTIRTSGMTEQDGAEAATALLGEGTLPSAVIAFNDRCALGLLDVLVRHGIRVPDELSVIGFDDSEIASRTPISMTSVRQDPTSLAQFAVERALQRLAATGPANTPRGTILPTSLTVRSTTGPAPR
jgi:DNA-binding LacI/PurR family transcriptional regulator